VLGVTLPLLGPYLEDRGVAALGVGLITALFSLPKLVYAPVLGARVDRGLWFRGVLTLHLVVSIVAAAAVGRLDGAWALGVALFLVGLGHGTVLPLVEATVLERLPPGGYGPLRLWGSLGFVAAAAAAATLVAQGGIEGFPLVLAASLVLLALTCLPFFSIHLRAAGYSGPVISGLWSLAVVAELVAFMSGGFLERRLGRRRLLGLALLVSPLRWLLLALPPSWAGLVAAQLGHAATFALVHLAGIQLVQAGVPAGAVRRAQALYSGLTFGLGVVAGSALAGPLYGKLGGAGAFRAAALLSCVLFVAWLPLARRLARQRGGEPDRGDGRGVSAG